MYIYIYIGKIKNKRQRTLKGQSRMDNPETLTTIKNGQSRDTDNNQEWTIQKH